MNLVFSVRCFLMFIVPVTIVTAASSQVQQLIDAVVVGESIELQCHSSKSDPVVWRYQKLSNTEITLWRDGKITQDYANAFLMTSHTSGDYNLIVLRVQMNSSGLYRCVEEGGVGDSHQTQLIVFASVPVCVANFSSSKRCLQYNNEFDIRCHVRFTGNCAPVFDCLPNAGNTVIRRTLTQAVEYTMHVVVSQPTKQQEYTCSMSFNCSNPDIVYTQVYGFEKKIKPVCDDDQSSNIHIASTTDQVSTDAMVTVSDSMGTTTKDTSNETIMLIIAAVGVPIMIIVIVILIIVIVKQRHHNNETHDPVTSVELLGVGTVDTVDGTSATAQAESQISLTGDGICHGARATTSAQTQTSSADDENDINVATMNPPPEVLEILLLKSFLRFFKQGHRTQQAEREAYRTLCSVSSDWCTTFGGCPDSYAKLKVKHQVKRLQGSIFCNYRRRPVKSAERLIDGIICGIACIGGNIFVLCREPKSVLLLDEFLEECTSNKEQQKYFCVANLEPEMGIAACRTTGCVYVGDSNEQVWSLTTGNEPKRSMDLKKRPEKAVHRLMSVTNKRLLILSPQGYFISCIPGSSKPKLFMLSFSAGTGIQHAVETVHKKPTIIVSHFQQGRGQPHQLTEYDMRGQELRHFGGEPGSDIHQLNKPGHMVLDASNQIVLADTHNDRVLLFDEELNVERILIDSGHDVRTPLWLCFNEATRQLIIGEWLTSTILQFDVVLQKPRKAVHSQRRSGSKNPCT